MKRLYERIISGALVLVTLFFVCSPVYASDGDSLNSPLSGDFWTWVQYSNNKFKSIFDKDKCPKSPNTNGLHEFVQTTTTVDGKDGLFYVCRYCGDSADIVGKKVHQQQVDSLPAPGYSSAGRLIWQPSLNDIDFNSCAVSVTDSLQWFWFISLF